MNAVGISDNRSPKFRRASWTLLIERDLNVPQNTRLIDAHLSDLILRMTGRWKALTERLGPAGAMRFLMQYDPGYGDYSKERHTISLQ